MIYFAKHRGKKLDLRQLIKVGYPSFRVASINKLAVAARKRLLAAKKRKRELELSGKSAKQNPTAPLNPTPPVDAAVPADFFDAPRQLVQPAAPAPAAELPADFFDNNNGPTPTLPVQPSSSSVSAKFTDMTASRGTVKDDDGTVKKMRPSNLPEGFFDDDNKDAKARGLDPKAKEAEKLKYVVCGV